MIWVSEAMGHLNGVTLEAHLGRALHEVIPDMADDLLPLLKEVALSRQAMRDVEIAKGPARRESRRRRLWRMSFIPALVEQWGQAGLVVFAGDVTEEAALIAAVGGVYLLTDVRLVAEPLGSALSTGYWPQVRV